MTIELVPLTTATIQLKDPIVIAGGPSGTRMIVEVESAVLEGERLSGKLRGSAAADWLTVGPDATGTLDVRITFETDDGAVIFVQYGGRLDLAKPLGEAPLYTAPLYETGDERYAWLNKVQSVGKGALDGQTLTYEIYELR